MASEASKAAAGLLGGARQNGMNMTPLFELAREAVLYFHNLQKFYVKKQASILGNEEKGVYRIAQNEEEKERILHVMDWQQKTGEDSYFLAGDTFARERAVSI